MALVPDQKFSTFDNGGDLEVGDIVVGLRNGLNTRFNYTGELPVGYIVPIANGGTGANNAADARTNLGLGTIAVQDADSVAITGGTIDGVAISSSTADLLSGTVAATPSAGTDIANKDYVDSALGGLVDSVTGTANEVDVDNTDPANPILSLSSTLDFPGTFTVQGSTAINEIIDDDTMATATATNIATAESIVAYIAAQLSGSGQLVQYVVATDSTGDTSTSTTLANSSLSANITPTSATNRIVVFTNTYCAFTTGSSVQNYAVTTAIYRSTGTPAILQGPTNNGWSYNTARANDTSFANATNIATEIAGDTNLHTYHLQFARLAGSGTATLLNNAGAPKIMIVMELLV